MSHLCVHLYFCDERLSGGQQERRRSIASARDDELSLDLLRMLQGDNVVLRYIFITFEDERVRAWERHRASGESSTEWSEMGQQRALELVSAEGLVRK